MNALAEFKDYYKRLDEMIAESTKADLAECARLLALNVEGPARYSWRSTKAGASCING